MTHIPFHMVYNNATISIYPVPQKGEFEVGPTFGIRGMLLCRRYHGNVSTFDNYIRPKHFPTDLNLPIYTTHKIITLCTQKP